uniref:Uncharacterized protein n=1 Tax=Arundo donax TaxID=35708 RepID=A0A0A9A2E5_ARUDO
MVDQIHRVLGEIQLEMFAERIIQHGSLRNSARDACRMHNSTLSCVRT